MRSSALLSNGWFGWLSDSITVIYIELRSSMLVWLVVSVAVGTGSDYVDNISCLPVSVVWPPEKGGPQSHSFSMWNVPH